MTYLDFQREADERTTSWERADPRAALVEKVDEITFRVMLQDGASSHSVNYARERGAYVGQCDCKGWDYRDEEDSPCAHLCVLRKAEFIRATDTNDQPIQAVDPAALEGGTETEPDRQPIADGGEVIEPPAAGEDGRVFGRPEEGM